MDPAEQQLRINEVLYLHSLWHNGPPRNPNPNPKSRAKSINLPPSNSTAFKKEINITKKKKKKNNRRRKVTTNNNPNPPAISDVEWPCEPISEPRQETGWPDSNQQSVPCTRSATAEEKARFFAVQLQQKGVKEFRDYFLSKVGSDYEGEDEEVEWMDDDDDDDDVDESKLFKFFLGIFTEDVDLRSYYEKNFEGGDFCCLVCGAIEKKGKRFKDCIALVQHSTAISKTKQKSAHRAFGHAVCRVIGWDTNRLPSIVLSSAEPLSRTLVKADSQVGSSQKEDHQEKVVESLNVNCELGSKEIDDDNQENDLQDKVVNSVSANDGRLMDCEAGPIEDDADDRDDLNEEFVDTTGTDTEEEEMDCMAGPQEDDADDQKEDLHKKITDTTGTFTGEAMDCMARLKEDCVGNQEEDFQKGIAESIETDRGKSVEGLHKGVVSFEENDKGELVTVQ